MMGCRWRLGWGPGWRLAAAAGAGGTTDPFHLVEGRVGAAPASQHDMDTTAVRGQGCMFKLEAVG